MKISKKELKDKYGIVLPEGKYDIKLEGDHYKINTIKDDTEGCIIVGAVNDRTDDDWVGSSKVAMSRLLPKIEDALAVKETVWIEIV